MREPYPLKYLIFILLLPMTAFGLAPASWEAAGTDTFWVGTADTTITSSGCYRFTGNLTSTATSGNIFAINGSDIRLEMSYDAEVCSLLFGGSGGDDLRGMYVANGKNHVTISGGAIVMLDSCDNSECFYIMPDMDTVRILEVDMHSDGYNSHCIVSSTAGAETYYIWGFEIYGGVYSTGENSYYSRMAYDGAQIMLSSKRTGGYEGLISDTNTYNFYVHGITLENTFGQGITIAPVNFKPCVWIEECTLQVDAYNDLYDDRDCDTMECETWANSSNAFSIACLEIGPYSRICNNVITSGTNYRGGRGILLESPYGGEGAASVIISGNDVQCHRGPYAHSLGVNGRCYAFQLQHYDVTPTYKIRHVIVEDNIFKVTGQNHTVDSSYGLVNRAAFFEISSYDSGYVTIRNNTFHVVSADGYDDNELVAVAFAENAPAAGPTVFENNRIITDRYAFSFGMGYECDSLLISSDTFEFGENVLADSALLYFYNASGADIDDNIILDPILGTGLSEAMVDYGPMSTTTGEVFFKRTVELFVTDSSDSPLPGAACSLWNAYGNLVGSGVSNGSGLFYDTVTYRYDSNDGDSTGYNDFVIKAILATDSAMNTSFTVSESSYADTLNLGESGAAVIHKKLRGIK